MNNKYKLGLAHRIKKDKRSKKWAKQRKEQGFDQTELWNLDHEMAKFLVPRLKAYCKISKNWFDREDIFYDEMQYVIETFDELIDCYLVDAKMAKKVNKAFKLLAKNYFRLWI